jgi:VIT1/CCC1 family predicted Fe2+/Mn2+ transporter
VLREGPIPLFLHGLLEYAAGAVLILAPFLLGFDSDSATAVSIVAGVLVIFVAATTDGPTSLVNQLPLAVHILLDYVLAGLLIAAPFLFGFSDETGPTAFFIALGVVHLLVTVGTRFLREEPG